MPSDSEMDLPCPLFEGSEKRIEVEFAFGAQAPVEGLRSLTREQLDSLMEQVQISGGARIIVFALKSVLTCGCCSVATLLLSARHILMLSPLVSTLSCGNVCNRCFVASDLEQLRLLMPAGRLQHRLAHSE